VPVFDVRCTTVDGWAGVGVAAPFGVIAGASGLRLRPAGPPDGGNLELSAEMRIG
jgi:hypothetical protein